MLEGSRSRFCAASNALPRKLALLPILQDLISCTAFERCVPGAVGCTLLRDGDSPPIPGALARIVSSRGRACPTLGFRQVQSVTASQAYIAHLEVLVAAWESNRISRRYQCYFD